MARRHKRKRTQSARQAAERQAVERQAVERQTTRDIAPAPSGAFGATTAPEPAMPDASGTYLLITLNSDLCAGSGDGFSSGIDQDVCYDVDGLPVIPARRLKGCLREAAEEIALDEGLATLLFGERGSGAPGALRIMNAQMLGGHRLGDQQTTLGQYSYTRAQTKMDRTTGSVMDNTLRFVRVVGQYMPDGKQMRFAAPVALEMEGQEGRAEEAWAALGQAALALRSIGMMRNRGFGAVRCELRGTWEEATAGNANDDASFVRRDVDGVAYLSYCVRLESDVMLPQQSGTRSAGFIPGTSVHGFFAGRLAGLVGSGELSQESFDQLFFGGEARFSPLYPVDGHGNRSLPAAPFVIKVKGGQRDGTCLGASGYVQRGGETPKPLKDGFMSPATWRPVEVAREIVYHHSTGRDATLYTQECLSPGQVMAGFVACPVASASLVERVLRRGALSFGRSKTAQYSRCEVVACGADLSHAGEMVDIAKGRSYALLLDSDTLLLGERGTFSTEEAVLERALSDVLGPCFAGSDASCGEEHPLTSVSVRTIGGYNAKWNQKKPHVQALAAGSCVVFEAQVNRSVPSTFTIGERQQEGYGLVRVIDLASVAPKAAPEQSDGEMAAVSDLERARLAAVRLADDERRRRFSKNGPLSSSFVGRLTLMATEATSAEDLDARIASVKVGERGGENRRDVAQGLIADLRKALGDDVPWAVEKECAILLLTMGKYFKMQEDAGKEGAR